jgi:hypothetical protein
VTQSARTTALLESTTPTTRTEWYDERWDVPGIKESDRARCQSWLESSGFLAASDAQKWEAIKTNWISFLSATSMKPNAILAPLRKAVRFGPRDFESPKDQASRFKSDRKTRRSLQQAVWKMLDGLEGLTERWPSKARETLNEPFDGGVVMPFETLVAKVNLRRRRRMNAVWTSLICFLVYSYDEGTLQEMGLFVSEELGDSILDIMEAELTFGCPVMTDAPIGPLETAVQDLFTEMITDSKATFPSSPLLWWIGVLVKSALSQGPDDYISRGRFNMNILPMDLDIRGRLEGLAHYSKVLVLDLTINTWQPAPIRLQEVQRELNEVNIEWLNADNDRRPAAGMDQRMCSSAAWKDLLKFLRKQRKEFLGEQKGTVMRQLWLLLRQQ